MVKMKMAVCLSAFFLALQWLIDPSYGQKGVVDCQAIETTLENCKPYVTGIADRPAPACCEGVDRLKSMIHTHEERVETCECIKEKVAHFRHINETTLTTLPSECGFQFHFPLSLNVDCTGIP